MEKELNVYRHEVKYYLHKRQAAELRLFLKTNMKVDSNGRESGSYWIRSLYFDTLDNRDYYEKVIGHYERKKIRLRIYDRGTAKVKLEIKNKYGNYTHKETVSIKREDAKQLIRGDSSCLLSYKEKTSNKVYALMHQGLYRPTVMIDYEREAYYYSFQNIRLTIDKNMRASFNSEGFFDEGVGMVSILNRDIYVLEVKYDHMIPYFLQKILSTFPMERSEISKYCLGRNILGK